MTIKKRLEIFAHKMKSQIKVLQLAYQDPRTPVKAKIILGITLAYALSPIDLIPDFIPVIGLLDDLILVPLGLYVAYKMIPTSLWQEYKERSLKL